MAQSTKVELHLVARFDNLYQNLEELLSRVERNSQDIESVVAGLGDAIEAKRARLNAQADPGARSGSC